MSRSSPHAQLLLPDVPRPPNTSKIPAAGPSLSFLYSQQEPTINSRQSKTIHTTKVDTPERVKVTVSIIRNAISKIT